MSIRVRRGTNTQRLSVILEEGEIAYTTDTKKFYVGDGITLGGTEIGGGTVASVTASSPLSSSGGANPNITIQDALADGSTKGAASFNASDFNASSGVISIDYTNGQSASGISKGFLTSADWTAFNNKLDPFPVGNFAELTSSVLNITGGSSSIIGAGITVEVKQSSATQGGYLSSADWSTFNSKGNGTVTSVGLTTGTTGTDVNVSGSPVTGSGSITLNIPDASATARGLITTGTQTLAGDKTFSSAPTFSTMTAGSLLFAGTSGLVSQKNANLFWDNTNNRLGINTTTPSQSLQIIGGYAQTQTVTTISGAAGAQSVALVIAPTTNSSGQHRAYNMSNQHNASGINFSGLQTTAGWFENRVINSGTHAELNGVIATGLLLASNSLSCGTVTNAYGVVGFGVNQFNTNSLTTTITNAVSLYASDQSKNTCTITNACGVMIGAQSKGVNNTDIVIGSTTIPSGTWSIYGASANNNYINGKLFIGTTTDAGYKLDVNGTTRSVTSIESPIVRGNTTASGSLTLSSTSNATKGSIIFGSSTYFFDEVNNCLKLGNVLPPTDSSALRLQVSNESSNATIACTAFTNTAAESGGINFARYRGTAASPSAVQSGDRLGLVASLGYDGSARQASSAILFSCDGAVSSGVMPGAVELQTGTSGAGRTTRLTISSAGNFTYFDGGNFILGTTTGTKIGTATSQKLSFWNATPIVQPTTAVTGATRVGGGGTTVTDTDTFDGYTIAQVVKALRNAGLLA